MLIGRVIGNIVSTIKDRDYQGHKLLLVQPLDLDMSPLKGEPTLIAVDLADSGEGEVVFYVDEGNAARQLLGLDLSGAARAVIVGVVDELAVQGQETWSKYPESSRRDT